GFRYYFTPLPGYFSPFPHGTDSLSVNRKYLGLPGGPGRFTRDSTNLVLLGSHPTATTRISTTGLSPSPVRLLHLFAYTHHPPRPAASEHRMIITTSIIKHLSGITNSIF